METENRLIAEFMEMQDTSLGWYDYEEFLQGIEYDNTFDELKFETNWNWLMEVVEKIESIEIIDRTGRFNLGSENFDENYTSFVLDNGEYFIQCEGETKKQATYNACVEFIKWYNEQTSQKYPFSEGDKYYTIEGSDIIRSYWDDVSEELYDEKPSKIYFEDLESALKHLEEVGVRTITIYDGGYAKTVNIN